MRIKRFNEGYSIPNYEKGSILLFSKKSLHENTVGDVCSDIDGCVSSEYLGTMDNTFKITTEVGREKEVGETFIEKYPSLFSGYERYDLRYHNLSKELSKISEVLDDLSMGDIGKKFFKSDDFNKNIDNIISRLQSLKIK